MRRFVKGADRGQNTLFPECLEDWIGEDNPVRVIDVFVDELELAGLGLDGLEPKVVTAHNGHRRQSRPSGAHRADAWQDRLDRPLHRPASALRDAHRRQGGRSAEIPARRDQAWQPLTIRCADGCHPARHIR